MVKQRLQKFFRERLPTDDQVVMIQVLEEEVEAFVNASRYQGARRNGRITGMGPMSAI